MRFIPLTNYKDSVIVSDSKYDSIVALDTNWCAVFRKLQFRSSYGLPEGICSTKKIYVQGKGKIIIQLSRFILNILDKPSWILAEHIDGNVLNCDDNNLRVSNNQQNLCNRGANINSKSGEKNITRVNRKWRVRLEAHGKFIHIGYYDTIEEAIVARNTALKQHHGEFARL